MNGTLPNRSAMTLRHPCLVLVLLLLTACGFHLRGYQEPATVRASAIYLQAADRGDIAQAVCR